MSHTYTQTLSFYRILAPGVVVIHAACLSRWRREQQREKERKAEAKAEVVVRAENSSESNIRKSLCLSLYVSHRLDSARLYSMTHKHIRSNHNKYSQFKLCRFRLITPGNRTTWFELRVCVGKVHNFFLVCGLCRSASRQIHVNSIIYTPQSVKTLSNMQNQIESNAVHQHHSAAVHKHTHARNTPERDAQKSSEKFVDVQRRRRNSA